jgi:hypothetical protein
MLIAGGGAVNDGDRQEAVARLMHGWFLVLTLIALALANAIAWFAVAQGWP